MWLVNSNLLALFQSPWLTNIDYYVKICANVRSRQSANTMHLEHEKEKKKEKEKEKEIRERERSSS
jgi:hypothetical protein